MRREATRPPRRVRRARGKVMGLRRLLSVLKRARRAGHRIVFTNGVYDLLHPGHAMLLERARGLGDILVVGINSDASVRRLKGPERPFMRGRERALMLAALEAVDYVVQFEQDTPLALIEAVQPDLLVKGGDWRPDGIVGREIVEARGGRVVRVKLVKGFSTTKIAAIIRKRRRG